MNIFTRITPLLCLIFLSAFAEASLLLEPYGGYTVGTESVQFSSTYPIASKQGYTDNASINGFAYGGRAGFLLRHFVIVAVDYLAFSGKEEFNLATTSVNWTQTTTFATLGFQAPMGFRFLGSYGFNTAITEDGVPATNYKGSAYKVVIGWRILSDVAINAEYTIFKLTDYTQNGVAGKVSDGFSKLVYSTAMITLSFPLEFFHVGGGGHSGGKSHSN